MAGVCHLCFLFELVLTCKLRNRDNLAHLEHTIGQRIEVTATHDENLCRLQTDLDCLEIVREVSRGLNRTCAHSLGLSVVEEEPF